MNEFKPAADFITELITIRRQFHRYPELAYQEFETTKTIAACLKSWGLNLSHFKNLQTGGFCDVGKGPIIAFRADIDALPITENPDHLIKSENPGIMHACGHDYHIAFGLAILKYFHQNRANPKHTIRVIFQPAEEAYPTGAVKVCSENIWQNIRYFVTAHMQNDLPIGTIAFCAGIANASSSSIEITLIGRGGHTSRPHETDDLVLLTANFISDLTTFLKSKINPLDSYTLVFGSLQGGTTHNVIPERITLKGTLRTLSTEVRGQIIKLMADFCHSFEKSFHIKILFENPTYCPPVINDQELAGKLKDFFSTYHSEKLVLLSTPSLGADDFAFYLTKAPGIYLKVGGGGKGIAHSSDFEIDEAAFAEGVAHLINFIAFLDTETR